MSGLDDLDRLFHRLVQVMAERGPERVSQPIQVAELYQDLVPYRQHRPALKLETHQDYEMALLRLVAGERGYARVEPEEAQQAFVMEVQAALPDAGVIHEFAAARVVLNAAAARKVLAGGEAIIIDVRAKDAWDMGHVEGALHFPLSELDARLSQLPKNKLIVAYCT